MTNEERRKAAEWFRNRTKNCQMPGARRMYEIATEALEMAIRALEGDGDMISRKEVMKEFSDCDQIYSYIENKLDQETYTKAEVERLLKQSAWW